MATSDDILNAIQGLGQTESDKGPDKENRAAIFRFPFTMTTLARLGQGSLGSTTKNDTRGKKIVFRCNPSEVSYDFPQRGATADTKEGKVFYFWKNATRGNHWDLPVITWTFQSGNIRPMIEQGDNVYLPEGLDNFYEFMSIIDEDKVLATGEPNFVVITHSSHIFPSLILKGFFDPAESTTFSENTEDGPQIKWQRRFYVFNSNPEFNSAAFKTIFGKGLYKDAYKEVTGSSGAGVKNTGRG